MKEIEATDDFLTLDKDVTKCQNKESLGDCQTRLYIDALEKQCGCLPFSVRNTEQVYLLEYLPHEWHYVFSVAG